MYISLGMLRRLAGNADDAPGSKLLLYEIVLGKDATERAKTAHSIIEQACPCCLHSHVTHNHPFVLLLQLLRRISRVPLEDQREIYSAFSKEVQALLNSKVVQLITHSACFLAFTSKAFARFLTSQVDSLVTIIFT